jgi:hypothetical protein
MIGDSNGLVELKNGNRISKLVGKNDANSSRFG